MNYRKISVTDDAKKLIKSILTVRKTVNQYVWFNIIFGIICIIILTILQLNYDPEMIKMKNRFSVNGDSSTFYAIYAVVLVIFISFFVLFIWLFYRLLYGILLRRLHKNHEELKKIDL
jgi:sterol desaturase/sphingolipid hydroxylase (fatty acid hydroxylase superfamily)